MAKFKKWIMIIGGSLLVLYLVALIASLLLVKSGEPAAFFNPRIGEHRPLVFAHQGGEYIRPTNTMIAFTDSRSLGADVLDADMHMTSDGVLILAHDETVDRTSDGTDEIRNLSLY